MALVIKHEEKKGILVLSFGFWFPRVIIELGWMFGVPSGIWVWVFWVLGLGLGFGFWDLHVALEIAIKLWFCVSSGIVAWDWFRENLFNTLFCPLPPNCSNLLCMGIKPGNRIRNTRLFGRLQCLFRYSVDDKNPNIIFGSFCLFCIIFCIYSVLYAHVIRSALFIRSIRVNFCFSLISWKVRSKE